MAAYTQTSQHTEVVARNKTSEDYYANLCAYDSGDAAVSEHGCSPDGDGDGNSNSGKQ